jgi:hypothetical protein
MSRRDVVPFLVGTLVLLAAAACASPSGGVAPEHPETVRISGGSAPGTMQITTVTTTAPNVAILAWPVAAVWRVLPRVFDSLGIATNTVDSKSYVMGNAGFRVRRLLGKVPLSKYIDCGNAQGPPSADTYEIQMSIVTQLTPGAGNATTVTTTLEASGRPITLSSEYSRCTSRGVLEPAIAAVAQARLRAGA